MALIPLLQTLHDDLYNSVEHNTLSLNRYTLKDAGAPILALFPYMGLETMELEGSFIFTPAEDGQTLRLTGGALHNDTLGLQTRPVDILFGVQGETLTAIMSIDAGEHYTLSSAIPDLATKASGNYRFSSSQNLVYTLTTHATEAFIPGLNLAAILDIVENAKHLSGFVPDGTTTLPVIGPVSYSDGVFSLSLAHQTPLPTKTLPIAGLADLVFPAPLYSFSIHYNSKTHHASTEQRLSADVQIGNTSLPLSIIFPFTITGWQLRYTALPTHASSCPALGDFLEFVRDYPLLTMAQNTCPLTGEFGINYLAIGISPDLSKFTHLNLSVSAAPSLRWDVAGQQLSLGNIGITFNLVHKDNTYTATGSIQALYNVTDSITVGVQLPIPVTSSDWIFTASASSEMSHMGDVSTVLGGTALATLLPCNLGNNKGTLGSLAVHYSPSQSRLTQVGLSFLSTIAWDIIPDRLSFDELQLNVTAYSPFSTDNLAARIIGTFRLGNTPLTATVSKDGAHMPWAMAVQVESADLGTIGDMTRLIGPHVGLDRLLPSCVTDIVVTLDALDIALTLTPSPSLNTISFSLTAQTNWQLIGSNILTLDDLNFAVLIHYSGSTAATNLYLGANLTCLGANFAVGANRDSSSNWVLSAELAPESSINLSHAFDTFLPGAASLLSAIGVPNAVLESAGIGYELQTGKYTMHATIGSGGDNPLWTIINTPRFAVNNLGIECQGTSQSGAPLTIDQLLLTSTLTIGSTLLPLALNVKELRQSRFTIAYHPNSSDLPTLHDLLSFVGLSLPSVIEDIGKNIALTTFALTVENTNYTLAIAIGTPPSWAGFALFPGVFDWRMKKFSVEVNCTRTRTTGSLNGEFSFILNKPLYLSMDLPGTLLKGVYEENFTIGQLVRYFIGPVAEVIPDAISDLGLQKLEIEIDLARAYFKARQYLTGELTGAFWSFKGMALVITYENGKLTICLCGILKIGDMVVECCLCYPFGYFRPHDPKRPPIPFPPPAPPAPPKPIDPIVPINEDDKRRSWDIFRLVVGTSIALALVAQGIYTVATASTIPAGKKLSSGTYVALKQFSDASQKGAQLFSSTATALNSGFFLSTSFTTAAFLTIGATIMAIAITIQGITANNPSDFVKGMHDSAGADVATPENAIQLLETSKDSFGGLTPGQMTQALAGTYNAPLAIPAIYEAFQLGSASAAAEFIYTHYKEGGVIIPIVDMAIGLRNTHTFTATEIANALHQAYPNATHQEYANALASISTAPDTASNLLLSRYSETFTDKPAEMITILHNAYQTAGAPIASLADMAKALAGAPYTALLAVPALHNSTYNPQTHQEMANALAGCYTAPGLAPGLLTVYHDTITSASLMASVLRTAYGTSLTIDTMAQALAASPYTVTDAIPALNTIYGNQEAQPMANALASAYNAIDVAPALVRTYSTTITNALQCGTILKTAYSQAGKPLTMMDMAQALNACSYALIDIIPVLQALYTALGLQAMANALAPLYPATQVAPALLAAYKTEITSAFVLATILQQAYTDIQKPLTSTDMIEALVACSYRIAATAPAIASLYFPNPMTQDDSTQLARMMIAAYPVGSLQLGTALAQCSNLPYQTLGKAITSALPNTPLPIVGALLFLLQDAHLPAAFTQATELASSGKTIIEAAPIITSQIPTLEISTLAAALISCYHAEPAMLNQALITAKGQAVDIGQVAEAFILIQESIDALLIASTLATAAQAGSIPLTETAFANGLLYAFKRVAQSLSPEILARAIVAGIAGTDSTKVAKALVSVLLLPVTQKSSAIILNALRAAFIPFTVHQGIDTLKSAFSLPFTTQEDIENILRPIADSFHLTLGQPSVGTLVAGCKIAGATDMLAVGNVICIVVKDWQTGWTPLILMAFHNSDWDIAYNAVPFGRKNGPEMVVQKVVQTAIHEGRPAPEAIRMIEMLVSLFDLYTLPNDITYFARAMKTMQKMQSPYTFTNTLPACQQFFGSAWTNEATEVLSREFA